RPEMPSVSAFAYGRAATTRSCARFILEVATISIVRVILRVFSTDLMRPFSSRPLAMIPQSVIEWWLEARGRERRLARDRDLLVLVDGPLQVRLDLLRQHLLGAEPLA